MSDEDIEEILSYKYWPSVTINELGLFTAAIYKYVAASTINICMYSNRTRIGCVVHA